jgi:hypothetical protein
LANRKQRIDEHRQETKVTSAMHEGSSPFADLGTESRQEGDAPESEMSWQLWEYIKRNGPMTTRK